jgi:hypothetical protein
MGRFLALALFVTALSQAPAHACKMPAITASAVTLNAVAAYVVDSPAHSAGSTLRELRHQPEGFIIAEVVDEQGVCGATGYTVDMDASCKTTVSQLKRIFHCRQPASS